MRMLENTGAKSVCVCVCLWQRETDRQTERQRVLGWEEGYENLCVCVSKVMMEGKVERKLQKAQEELYRKRGTQASNLQVL